MPITNKIIALALCVCFSLSSNCLNNNGYGDYYKESVLKSNGKDKADGYVDANKDLKAGRSDFQQKNDLKQPKGKKAQREVNFNDFLQSENLMIDD